MKTIVLMVSKVKCWIRFKIILFTWWINKSNPFCEACKERDCCISFDGTCSMLRVYLKAKQLAVVTSDNQETVHTVRNRIGGYLVFVAFIGTKMILERSLIYNILKNKKVNNGVKNFTGI